MDKLPTQDINGILRHTLRRLLRKSNKSSATVAEELSRALGRNVSLSALNKWAGEFSIGWRLPADAVPALGEILHDDALQRQLLSEKMKEALEIGEWVVGSRWILERVKAEIPKPPPRARQKP